MEFTEILNTIGNQFFPIVAAVALWLQTKKKCDADDKMKETLSELSTTLAIMSDRLKDVEIAVGISESGKEK